MCRGELCPGRAFLLNYVYAGQSRQVKQQIIDMGLNGSGIAVFLASKDGRYIHGTSLFIDGGLMQNMGQGA